MLNREQGLEECDASKASW